MVRKSQLKRHIRKAQIPDHKITVTQRVKYNLKNMIDVKEVRLQYSVAVFYKRPITMRWNDILAEVRWNKCFLFMKGLAVCYILLTFHRD